MSDSGVSTVSWLSQWVLSPAQSSKLAPFLVAQLGLANETEAAMVVSVFAALMAGMVVGFAMTKNPLGLNIRGIIALIKYVRKMKDKKDLQKVAGKDEYPKNYVDTPRESGIEPEYLPKHICVIMDGNRRFGKKKYGKGTLGHIDGSKQLVQFMEWCHTEGIKYLTVYAFSTENFNRSPQEVETLMNIFSQYMRQDLRPILHNRKIKFKLLCTESDKISAKVLADINEAVELTANNDEMQINIAISYGSRGEITLACKKLAQSCVDGKLKVVDITEDSVSQSMQTSHSPDPDIMLRTSGEYRISNYLLWQLAYAEFFFFKQDWPELTKKDFLGMIRSFAKDRKRRFGK